MAAHGGCVRPVPGPRPVHRHRRHLRRQARRARPRAGSYKPSIGGFVLLTGVLLFNFVGFELPNSAGEEMVNPQRDVPFSIFRSAIGSVALYALPVLGILIVLPNTAVQNFSGFASAMQDAFTVYGGHMAADGTATLSGAGTALGDICALLFIVCLITSGATWIMGSDRALAVSCYDGAGPRFLGVISAKFGTPVRVNIFSGSSPRAWSCWSTSSPTATRPSTSARSSASPSRPR